MKKNKRTKRMSAFSDLIITESTLLFVIFVLFDFFVLVPYWITLSSMAPGSPPLRIVFAGTPAFAVPSLEALARSSAFSVDLVITQPDKPVGRKGIITPPPVKIAAERLGISVWQPEKINDAATHAKLDALHCDYLVVVAYGQLLKESLLALPKLAPINLHASLLPRWRGASPIQHAILAGDTTTGVTVQRMIQKLDAGPVLARKSVSIGPRETYTELHDRLTSIGANLLVQTLTADTKPVDQETDGITVCKKLARASGVVDPNIMTAQEIDRRVRALCPWPGVTLSQGDGPSLKILACDLRNAGNAAALLCKDQTTLYLVSVQVPGGKPITGKEWERSKR